MLALLVPLLLIPGAIPAFLGYVLYRRLQSRRPAHRVALVALCAAAAAGAVLLAACGLARFLPFDLCSPTADPPTSV